MGRWCVARGQVLREVQFSDARLDERISDTHPHEGHDESEVTSGDIAVCTAGGGECAGLSADLMVRWSSGLTSGTVCHMFSQVVAKSSADAVFDQVCDQIVGGRLEPGATLPGERELASQLNVSRSVVREALGRLAQAGLVEIRQGEATRILDYQAGTDIDLLGRLLVRANGSIDAIVLRSMLEMRISIGADAARLCALRRTEDLTATLADIVDRLASTDDILQKQDIDLEFWASIVSGSQNIGYRLAYNGLVATYRPLREVIATVVEPELQNIKGHTRTLTAIAKGDTKGAERSARALLESSSTQWAQLLEALELQS